MITISPVKVLYLFIVSVTAGSSAPATFHREISAQMLVQESANGIIFGVGNLLIVNNLDPFDPLSYMDLPEEIAIARTPDLVFYL